MRTQTTDPQHIFGQSKVTSFEKTLHCLKTRQSILDDISLVMFVSTHAPLRDGVVASIIRDRAIRSQF